MVSKKQRTASRPATVDRLAPDDAALREFISDFSAASALMQQLRRRLAEALGLSVSGYSVLLGLWHCQRRSSTTVRDLAKHLHVAAAHVTAELNKLDRFGFIIKQPSESDGRAVNVSLSAKGNALLDRLVPVLKDVNDELFADIRYQDMLIVQHFFDRVIGQASAAIRIAEFHAVRGATQKNQH